MKFGEDEKKVASCLFFRADLPFRAAAEETGLKEHVVRRCLRDLLDREILRLRPFVNPFAVGLQEYIALIATHGMSSEGRQSLLTLLKESRHTTYVATIGGDYHLAVMFVARTQNEVVAFLDSVAESCAGYPPETVVASCKAVTIFAPKFLGVPIYGPRSLTYAITEKVHTLDSLDHKILHSLESLHSPSGRELARVIGAPAATVNYRLDALRERGISLAIGYTIAPFRDNLFAYAFQVFAAGMPRSIKDQFIQFCSEHPAISFALELIGNWTFQVGARLSDPRQVVVVEDQIRKAFSPYITNVGTMAVHETLKLFPHPLKIGWPGEYEKSTARGLS